MLAAVEMHLLEDGGGGNEALQVSEAPGDLQRLRTGRKRLVQLTEQRVDDGREAEDPAAPVGRRRGALARIFASCRRSSARRTSPSWISACGSSSRMSKACSSVDGLSRQRWRGFPAPDRRISTASRLAPRA